MGMDIVRLIGTTDSGGDLAVNHTTTVVGLLYAVEWIDGTFDDGVGFTLTAQGVPGEQSAATSLLAVSNNNDARYYPRAIPHGPTGTALTATAGGDNVLPVIAGTPRLVVAAGGNAKTGGVILYIIKP